MPDPGRIAQQVVGNTDVQDWALVSHANDSTVLTRVAYYDARPDADEDVSDEILAYWRAIELLPGTHLGSALCVGAAIEKLRVRRESIL